MVNVLRINPEDNVVVALSDLPQGTRLQWAEADARLNPALSAANGIITQDPIPFGHKAAIAPIAQGRTVVKYGASIGLASADIAPGQHVHVHNLSSVRGAAKR